MNSFTKHFEVCHHYNGIGLEIEGFTDINLAVKIVEQISKFLSPPNTNPQVYTNI